MRQITMQAASSLMNGKNFKRGNTHVVNNSLYLFGNKIAELRDGELWITSAGWKTNTTKERLNGLPGVNIFQKNKTWYLNNHTWNGEWVRIKTKQN